MDVDWYGLAWYVQHLKPSGFISLLVHFFLSWFVSGMTRPAFSPLCIIPPVLLAFSIRFEACVHSFFSFVSSLGTFPGYFPGFLFRFLSSIFLPSCADGSLFDAFLSWDHVPGYNMVLDDLQINSV
jgi:hypothetical protein